MIRLCRRAAGFAESTIAEMRAGAKRIAKEGGAITVQRPFMFASLALQPTRQSTRNCNISGNVEVTSNLSFVDNSSREGIDFPAGRRDESNAAAQYFRAAAQNRGGDEDRYG
jgi:hypothetical protein